MEVNLPVPVTNKLTTLHNITNNILPPKLDYDDLSIFDDEMIDNSNILNDSKNIILEHNDIQDFQYYYLVYTTKSKLVKIGITNETYEICKIKYKKIYGSIDKFNYMQVENRMTKHRLERAFYSFFIDTRLFTGKEFFAPIDSKGRDMIPIYLTILKILASNDMSYIRLFYLEHGLTLEAARKWINNQFSTIELSSSIEQHSSQVEQQVTNTTTTIDTTNKSLLINLSALDSLELSRVDNNTMTYQKEEIIELISNETNNFNELLNLILYDVEHININNHTLHDANNNTIVPISQDVNLIEADVISSDIVAKQHVISSDIVAKQHVISSDIVAKQLFVYLVYSNRSNKVKVSYTYDTYEENLKKFTKIYGHLSSFNYISIENDLLSGNNRLQWLERAFYNFFIDTRLFTGKEFFAPIDSKGRDMIPIYLTILKILASKDISYIRLFYLEHGLTLEAARKWINNQFSTIELTTTTTINHKMCNIIVSPQNQEDIITNPSFPSAKNEQIDENFTMIDL